LSSKLEYDYVSNVSFDGPVGDKNIWANTIKRTFCVYLNIRFLERYIWKSVLENKLFVVYYLSDVV